MALKSIVPHPPKSVTHTTKSLFHGLLISYFSKPWQPGKLVFAIQISKVKNDKKTNVT